MQSSTLPTSLPHPHTRDNDAFAGDSTEIPPCCAEICRRISGDCPEIARTPSGDTAESRRICTGDSPGLSGDPPEFHHPEIRRRFAGDSPEIRRRFAGDSPDFRTIRRNSRARLRALSTHLGSRSWPRLRELRLKLRRPNPPAQTPSPKLRSGRADRGRGLWEALRPTLEQVRGEREGGGGRGGMGGAVARASRHASASARDPSLQFSPLPPTHSSPPLTSPLLPFLPPLLYLASPSL
jgi:hypothetical protein